jgi:hypothetical protein
MENVARLLSRRKALERVRELAHDGLRFPLCAARANLTFGYTLVLKTIASRQPKARSSQSLPTY